MFVTEETARRYVDGLIEVARAARLNPATMTEQQLRDYLSNTGRVQFGQEIDAINLLEIIASDTPGVADQAWRLKPASMSRAEFTRSLLDMAADSGQLNGFMEQLMRRQLTDNGQYSLARGRGLTETAATVAPRSISEITQFNLDQSITYTGYNAIVTASGQRQVASGTVQPEQIATFFAVQSALAPSTAEDVPAGADGLYGQRTRVVTGIDNNRFAYLDTGGRTRVQDGVTVTAADATGAALGLEDVRQTLTTATNGNEQLADAIYANAMAMPMNDRMAFILGYIVSRDPAFEPSRVLGIQGPDGVGAGQEENYANFVAHLFDNAQDMNLRNSIAAGYVAGQDDEDGISNLSLRPMDTPTVTTTGRWAIVGRTAA